MSRSKYVYTTHSKSLWNISQSPGWEKEENDVLRLAVMRYGMGNWVNIVKLGLLPGKTIAQMNIQVQRMLGQQSTGGFNGIHLDPLDVRRDNEERLKTDTSIRLKTGLIINDGENPTKESRKRKLEENQAKYGLSQETIDGISLEELFKVKRVKRIKHQHEVERLRQKRKATEERETPQSEAEKLVSKFNDMTDKELDAHQKKLEKDLKAAILNLYGGTWPEVPTVKHSQRAAPSFLDSDGEDAGDWETSAGTKSKGSSKRSAGSSSRGGPGTRSRKSQAVEELGDDMVPPEQLEDDTVERSAAGRPIRKVRAAKAATMSKLAAELDDDEALAWRLQKEEEEQAVATTRSSRTQRSQKRRKEQSFAEPIGEYTYQESAQEEQFFEGNYEDWGYQYQYAGGEDFVDGEQFLKEGSGVIGGSDGPSPDPAFEDHFDQDIDFQ